MNAAEYISVGIEAELVTDLRNGRSLSIAGERRSGVTTLTNHLRALLASSDGNCGQRQVEINARLLGPGTEFLHQMAALCVHAQYGATAPPALREVLDKLNAKFDQLRLIELLEGLNEGRTPSLVIIDRFEYVARSLDAAVLASIRDLIEKRLIQLLLLSRLSMSEIDKLVGSRLAPSIRPVSLPLADTKQRRGLALLELQGIDVSEDVLDYIGEIVGGHRCMIREVARRVRQRARDIGLSKVSSANAGGLLAYCIPAIEGQIAEVFGALAPREDLFKEEFEAERRCAFGVLFAPAWLLVQSPELERLKRLGHLTPSPGGVVRLSSPLVTFLLRRRYQEFRAEGIGANFSDWLDYDEALRSLIRQRATEPLEQIVAAGGDKFAFALDEWRRDRLLWNTTELDPLDYLLADGLQILLQQRLNLGTESLLKRPHDIEVVSNARRPMTQALWEMRAAKHDLAAVLLKPLLAEVRALLDASRPRRSTREYEGSQRAVRWLHISDCHFKEASAAGEDAVLSAFLRTIEEEMDQPSDRRLGPPPDMVFFTGDLAYSGKKQEYQRAEKFLDGLLRALGLNRDRLFLVPGNHDVDRTATRYLARTLEDADAVHSAFHDSRWRRLYGERLAAFTEFCRSYFSATVRPYQEDEFGFQMPQRARIRDVEIFIHLLNWQWCGGLDDDRSRLIFGGQLMMERIRSTDCSADLRLALIHQPSDYLTDWEEKAFHLGIGREVDLVLRGHLHANELTTCVTTKGEMLELAAGALFSDIKNEHRNSAQFVELDIETRQLTVYPIRYEPDQRKWERDTGAGERPDYLVRRALPGGALSFHGSAKTWRP